MKKRILLPLLLLVLFVFTLVKPIIDSEKNKPLVKDEPPIVTEPETVVEQPLHHVKLPDFAAIGDVKQKKSAFFSFLSPAVIKENQRIKELRHQIDYILIKLNNQQSLSVEDGELIHELTRKYKINKSLAPIDKLLALKSRVDIVPTELVLVQAANESAWGTSRFARIGLNFFGIWCFKKGCGMVPKSRTQGLNHEVAAFKSVDKAVQHYMYNINTNSAYTVLRKIRAQLRQENMPLTGEILATGLLPYSERGTDYVLEISEMIRHNQRYFDKPSLKVSD